MRKDLEVDWSRRVGVLVGPGGLSWLKGRGGMRGERWCGVEWNVVGWGVSVRNEERRDVEGRDGT